MPRGGKRAGAGRPKGSGQLAKVSDKSDFASKVRAKSDEIIEELMNVLKNAKSDTARVQAASVLLDRAYGRPPPALSERPAESPMSEILQSIQRIKSSAPIVTDQV